MPVCVGLFGDEGVVPVRLLVPRVQSPLLEQLQAAPSLLWLGPTLGLGPQQCLEIICLLGALLSLGAILLGALRDSLVYLLLWVLYLSLYTVSISVCVSLPVSLSDDLFHWSLDVVLSNSAECCTLGKS